MKINWIYNSSEDFIEEEDGQTIDYGADVNIIDKHIVLIQNQ